MKQIYNYTKHLLYILLFFSLKTFTSEYYNFTNKTQTLKPNLHFSQQKPQLPPFTGSRARHLNRMIQNNILNKQYALVNSDTTSLTHNNLSQLQQIYIPLKIHRSNIIQQFINNNPITQRIYLTKYCITEISKKYLDAHNINSNKLALCEGNAIQQVIHQEFIKLTDVTAHLWNECINSPDIQQLTQVIADFTDSGISFNNTGEIKKAMTLADAGWAILDCIQAAGEGVIEGISSLAHTITHPIQTIQNFTYATINCGYYLGIALQEINCVTEAIMQGNFDIAHNKYTAWSEQCANISHLLTEKAKELRLRDIIKTATQFSIETYATTRALNGFTNLFQQAHHNALQITQKISLGAQESTVLMSAEGILLRIAQETLTQAKKLPRANDKLLQVLSQFKSKKIKVGNFTCLLDKKGLKHILERHHPNYWNGTLRSKQSFFNKNTTVTEIVNIVKQIIKQNKKIILNKGVIGKYQIDGVFKNIPYIVGFDNGRIGQFYIPFK